MPATLKSLRILLQLFQLSGQERKLVADPNQLCLDFINGFHNYLQDTTNLYKLARLFDFGV